MNGTEIMRRCIGLGLMALLLAMGSPAGFAAETGTAAKGEAEAEAFYDKVSFKIDQITETSAVITATAPEAMFCPFTYGTDKTYGQMRFMDMTSPSRDHMIKLTDLKPASTYYYQINAVLPDLRVYKSRVIQFTTGPNPKGVNSLKEGKGKARIPDFKDAGTVLTYEAEVAQLKSNYALIKYSSFKPAFSAVALGADSKYGQLKRMAVVKPKFDHEVQLVGLKQQSDYRSRVILVDRTGKVYLSDELAYKTPEQKGFIPEGSNVALLSMGATVTKVSSEWGPGFAGVMAINGDSEKEWASDGDGNDAAIEITLAKKEKIHAVGFWTRTMGSSAQIRKFKVVADGGKEFGPFDVPDATQPYYFKIPTTETRTLRFKVIDSNGGRTGAISVEAYAK
jgi:hypothetical protein